MKKNQGSPSPPSHDLCLFAVPASPPRFDLSPLSLYVSKYPLFHPNNSILTTIRSIVDNEEGVESELSRSQSGIAWFEASMVEEYVMVIDRSGEGGGWSKQTDEAGQRRWRHEELDFFLGLIFLVYI